MFVFLGINHITKEKISFIQVLGEGAFGRGFTYILLFYFICSLFETNLIAKQLYYSILGNR